MAQEKFKEVDNYDEDYDNDDYDDYDDYDEEEGEHRRTHTYSGSGTHYDLSDDSRLRKDHHNQLERKRRASIKSSYTELREAIPSLKDNKASRSNILQRAVEYLEELNKRNSDHVACVEHFNTENAALEARCREMEQQVNMILRQQRNFNGNGNYLENNHGVVRNSVRTNSFSSGSQTGGSAMGNNQNVTHIGGDITSGSGSVASGNEEEGSADVLSSLTDRSSSTGSGNGTLQSTSSNSRSNRTNGCHVGPNTTTATSDSLNQSRYSEDNVPPTKKLKR